MGRFFKQLQPYIPLLVFLLPVLIGLIGRLAKTLSNQAKKRQAEQDRLRREMDAIRTGSIASEPMASPTATDAMDARRRAALAALDKRRLERSQSATMQRPPVASRASNQMGQQPQIPKAQQRPGTRQQGTRTKPPVPVRGSSSPPLPASQQGGVPNAAAQRRRELQQKLERQRGAALQSVVEQTQLITTTQAALASRQLYTPQSAHPAPPAPTTTRPIVSPRWSITDMRRAIVLNELLNRPVSERDE